MNRVWSSTFVADSLLVAGRELRARVWNRGFVVGNLLSLVVLAVVTALPGIIGDRGPEERTVAVVADDARAERLARLAAGDERLELEIRRDLDDAGAEAAVTVDGDDGVDAAVLADGTVVVQDELDDELRPLLEADVRLGSVGQRLGGAAASEVETALTTTVLTVRALEPPDPSERNQRRLVTIGVFVLLAQVLGYGFWLASGVVEEKASRVVEVLVAKVGPGPLLAGKLLGLGIVGIATIVVNAVVAVGAGLAAGSFDLPPGWPVAVGQLLGWFVLMFFLYAAAFIASGAVVSRQEELQNSTGPMQIVLFAVFGVAGFASANPDGLVAAVASFVPLTAPAVMPIRLATGNAVGWHAVLAALGSIVAGAALLAGAARLYAGGLLQTRGTLSLRQAWRGGAVLR